ncbi:MAG: DNA repair protein RecN, partial [Rhodothermales bacterium]
GEEEELESERTVLENAERLYEATSTLHAALYESDGSVHDQLGAIHSELQDLVRIDPFFEETLAEIESARIIASEAAKFLQTYNGRIEFNPDRLEEIRIRLGELDRLERKYGGSLDSVLIHREEIGRTYEIAQDFEGALARLEKEISSAQEVLSSEACELSRQRKEAALRVAEDVSRECAKLGMAESRFEVRFQLEDDPRGWITVDGRRVKAFEQGIDQVEFYISTNAGERPKPLARVASGGEVSRIMLALKTILARAERFPILVFDEIDVGISGSVASKVGASMHELSASHQIIAITHLPQIAARGDVHFLVEKYVEAGRTKTRIRRLEQDLRAEHVASLMSGAEVGESALETARELLGASRRRVGGDEDR